ncbi:MAG: prepilin-type N-terminal cleavage/methylation domain-containing protein [Marinobacter sp.]|uniref:prepilin-type N-terminal cleavage/methylation domain-containing protein n=1 Tax=Marinobacter sp. TaxID=50741 RepID=UPI00299F45EA|nr:prepilin-type N-terminal cleavage/methylation domain-containing protein [Marinobacter sp.]MDX1636300.1 prepilin-type N-terminal cleavage/methylation domain-containing protein [Marinobacter sp.]
MSKGFTLIELVVVIAILAILAAFALPRFAQLSDQAHDASIQGTAGALAAGVALAKTQWVANGQTAATDNVEDFGNGQVDVSAEGWPTSTTADNNSANMTAGRCVQVWQGVLQANAPSVTGATPDYDVTVQADADGNEPGQDCVFTYQLDGEGSTIGYDADTGEVTTVIN